MTCLLLPFLDLLACFGLPSCYWHVSPVLDIDLLKPFFIQPLLPPVSAFAGFSTSVYNGQPGENRGQLGSEEEWQWDAAITAAAAQLKMCGRQL